MNSPAGSRPQIWKFDIKFGTFEYCRTFPIEQKHVYFYFLFILLDAQRPAGVGLKPSQGVEFFPTSRCNGNSGKY